MKNLKEEHFLIVDDEISIRKAMGIILKKQGYNNLFFANNGQEAMRIFMDNPEISIVFSDFMMKKDGNGDDLYMAIRSQLETRKGKFILVTGGAPTEDTQKRLEILSNLVKVIYKPFSVEDILKALKS